MVFLGSDENIEKRFLGQLVLEPVTAYRNSHGSCKHPWRCPSVMQPDTAELEKVWLYFCLDELVST